MDQDSRYDLDATDTIEMLIEKTLKAVTRQYADLDSSEKIQNDSHTTHEAPRTTHAGKHDAKRAVRVSAVHIQTHATVLAVDHLDPAQR